MIDFLLEILIVKRCYGFIFSENVKEAITLVLNVFVTSRIHSKLTDELQFCKIKKISCMRFYIIHFINDISKKFLKTLI